ncbi:DUF1697 domain-containing protein [Nocardioides bruguierae]|uniref:DUF1697 domain-containing protein n=1 Tax=Nocardioides bruguierae TaxID=2945102 RepID=UPI002020C694|nr:DUF1697 domain-containing protein [Nocardioides bruguierae]MCL8025615.1 DUF1697 domain-containing protein [Nocardioides bruguierae]
MATYVAFLRAINLGATRKFPKADIVRTTSEAGFEGVETYINTGNVRLTTAMRSRLRIEAALEKAYAADRGFEVPTIVFTPGELAEVDAAARAVEHDGKHYVALLRDLPDEAGLAALRARCAPGERMEVGGRALHWLVGADGVHGTKITNNLIERLLGTVATTRNPTVIAEICSRWG